MFGTLNWAKSWFLFCWVGFSNIYMHFKVPVWHWSQHDLHLTSNDLKKHNFAIFEPISLFSTPKCSKFNPNFELEVKCGSYKAKFNWRSKLLTLPFHFGQLDPDLLQWNGSGFRIWVAKNLPKSWKISTKLSINH